jgi:hypothetical protein
VVVGVIVSVVTPAPQPYLARIEDVRGFMGIETRAHDYQIVEAIRAATSAVEAYTGRVFARRRVVERVEFGRSARGWLTGRPVAELHGAVAGPGGWSGGGVTVVDAAGGEVALTGALGAADYLANPLASFAYGAPGAGLQTVDLDYTGGHVLFGWTEPPDLPGDVGRAAVIVAARLARLSLEAQAHSRRLVPVQLEDPSAPNAPEVPPGARLTSESLGDAAYTYAYPDAPGVEPFIYSTVGGFEATFPDAAALLGPHIVRRY